jgi:hypothetical protein
MATLFQLSLVRATDSNGDPLSGAKLYVYGSGGSTLSTLYSDAAATSNLSNPVISDSSGVFPPVFINELSNYRVKLTNSGGSLTVYDADPGFGGSSVTTALATGTVSALVGTRTYATQALLYADLAHSANDFALVYADSTATKNDLYVKSGASGSGSWSATGIFSSAAAAYATNAAASASAAASSAAPLIGTSTTRGTTTANTSSATAGASFTLTTPTSADGMLTSFAFRLSALGTGEIHLIQVQGAFKVNVGVYPITASSGVNTITLGSAGAHTACPSLPDTLYVPAGTYLSYVPLTGGTLRYDAGIGSDIVYQVNDDSGLGASTISFTSITNVILGLSFTVMEGGVLASQPVVTPTTDTRFTTASLAVSGFNLTLTGTLYRNGSTTGVKDTKTVSAATNVRYDVYYLDLDTLAFGVQTGTDRANDAAEFIPAMSSSTRLPVFNLRVTSSAVTYTPVWGVFNTEIASLSPYLSRERDRSRKCLRKTIQRIRRVQNLKYLVIGDSISALVAETPSLSTPNGQYRDRAASTGTTFTYLRDKIGTDAPNYPTLVTSVSMGLADDGAGTVHTKFGFNWEFLNELVAAGYTLGSGGLEYYNFAVNGKASTDAATGGSLTSWGTAAVALAPHVAVIEFGMNELANTSTEANLITLANAFKAAGSEVVFIGVPRRRDTMVGWYYTNRAILRAARYTNSAYIDTVSLYDNPYIGAIGLSIFDPCTANGVQHPGILEHRTIGAN